VGYCAYAESFHFVVCRGAVQVKAENTQHRFVNLLQKCQVTPYCWCTNNPPHICLPFRYIIHFEFHWWALGNIWGVIQIYFHSEHVQSLTKNEHNGANGTEIFFVVSSIFPSIQYLMV